MPTKNGCGSGKSCVYVDRNKWIPYEDISIYKPPELISDSWKQEDTTLFLMIASFRDKLCPRTLFYAYTKAKYPKRIHIGLVQQNTKDDIDCVEEYCRLMNEHTKSNNCLYKGNIRVVRKDATESKGPTWSRAIGSTLLQNEEFCMQTDSHMNFLLHWDTNMMSMWASVNNEYGILSTYVSDSSVLKTLEKDNNEGINGLHEVPHLCMITFDGSYGLVRNTATKAARMLPSPKLTNAIWGAGLSFSKCHAERKVPYDPHTPLVFDGEEYSRAARYWTYGYDIYTPNRIYIVHDYQVSQSDPTHMAWYSNNGFTQDSIIHSTNRLKMLLGMPTLEETGYGSRMNGGATNEINNSPQDTSNTATSSSSSSESSSSSGSMNNYTLSVLNLRHSKYGLGDRRTLKQLIEFSGIDTIHRKILANRCGSVAYVPFTEHPLGATYIPKYDVLTEEYIDIIDSGSIYYTSINPHEESIKDGIFHSIDTVNIPITMSTTLSSSSSSSSSSSASVKQIPINKEIVTKDGIKIQLSNTIPNTHGDTTTTTTTTYIKGNTDIQSAVIFELPLHGYRHYQVPLPLLSYSQPEYIIFIVLSVLLIVLMIGYQYTIRVHKKVNEYNNSHIGNNHSRTTHNHVTSTSTTTTSTLPVRKYITSSSSTTNNSMTKNIDKYV